MVRNPSLFLTQLFRRERPLFNRAPEKWTAHLYCWCWSTKLSRKILPKKEVEKITPDAFFKQARRTNPQRKGAPRVETLQAREALYRADPQVRTLDDFRLRRKSSHVNFRVASSPKARRGS
jgi:hypothetical protein